MGGKEEKSEGERTDTQTHTHTDTHTQTHTFPIKDSVAIVIDSVAGDGVGGNEGCKDNDSLGNKHDGWAECLAKVCEHCQPPCTWAGAEPVCLSHRGLVLGKLRPVLRAQAAHVLVKGA